MDNLTINDLKLTKSSKLDQESLESRFARYLGYFTVSLEAMQTMLDSCMSELELGLILRRQNPNCWQKDKCSLRMLDTCVDVMPTGKETGVFYAIDFGGTNMRAVRVELFGNGESSERQEETRIRDNQSFSNLPKGLLDKNATATLLFDSISRQIKKLMDQEGDLLRDEILQLGLTFSFACDQKKLGSAVLTGWSKGFETGTNTKDPVVGRDVCALLNVSFERNGVPAEVVASSNDTTGTLLAAAYERSQGSPLCVLGVILGTGMNCCYWEPNAKEYSYTGNIINTEFGAFNKNLPRNVIDFEIDYASSMPGEQLLEKIIAGLYIPEICRRTILKVFQDLAPKLAWVRNTLSGKACAAIMNDTSYDLNVTKYVVETLWDWSPSFEHLSYIQQLFHQIFDRSAAMASVVIAALAKKTGRLQPAMNGLSVGVDGSLYTKNIKYRQMITTHLKKILGEDTADLIKFVITKDGSGKGAAVLASCVFYYKHKNYHQSNSYKTLYIHS